MSENTEERTIMRIIRIGNPEKRFNYAYSILLAMAPEEYDHEKGIIIEVLFKHLEIAERLIKLFRYAGLEEMERTKSPLIMPQPDGTMKEFPNSYKIILKKIPALRHIS